MAQPRPFITCHVLETVAGKPAANMNVALSLVSPASAKATFEARTNSDGRVTSWNSSNTTLEATIEEAKKELKEDEQMIWSITFQTGEFYGAGKTFWPEVELRFFTSMAEKHYHVPLLLGPWSYTTYRVS